MSKLLINTWEDMQWLFKVHLTKIPRNLSLLNGSAVVWGNEDCPEKIDLYANNNPKINDSFRRFVYDADKDEYQESDVTFDKLP